ncbi:hypothetical protein [Pseudalkalibacillus salsuginis]|uniref:hypothetical protein n=1 Tax=Pseudalkalibacillus salsuginis TaxID=2910972 RepID=UPI001F22CB0E|nr:hypothetical protein [Pseudalkalibacillus salsuginis]MCF6412034.1 hypothetical protein [Pseudalkalibacillus salsuginis]
MKVLEYRGSSYQIRAGEANRNKEAALDDGKYTETNRCDRNDGGVQKFCSTLLGWD